MGIHRSRWTAEEDARLRELIRLRMSPTLMAAKLERSVEAIRMRVISLRRKDSAIIGKRAMNPTH